MRKVEFIFVLLCVFIIISTKLMAAPTTVDFESVPGITAMANRAVPVPETAKLYDQLIDEGVLFNSDSNYVPVVRLGAGHATSGIYGIGGSTPDGHLTYDGNSPVILAFVCPGNPSIPAVTDFVSIRGDMWGNPNDVGVLRAYDINGKLIAEDIVANTGGQRYKISAFGIHTVKFVGTVNARGIALDDLCFNTPVPLSVYVLVEKINKTVYAFYPDTNSWEKFASVTVWENVKDPNERLLRYESLR